MNMSPDLATTKTLIVVVTRISCNQGDTLDEFCTHWAIPQGVNARTATGYLYPLDNDGHDLLLVHGHRGITDDILVPTIIGAWQSASGRQSIAGDYQRSYICRHSQAGSVPLANIDFSALPPARLRLDYSSSHGGSRDPAMGFLSQLREYLNNCGEKREHIDTLVAAIEDKCILAMPQIINGLHGILNLLLALRLNLDTTKATQSTDSWAHACDRDADISAILKRAAFDRFFGQKRRTDHLSIVFVNRGAFDGLSCKRLWQSALPTRRMSLDLLESGAYVGDIARLAQAANEILDTIGRATGEEK